MDYTVSDFYHVFKEKLLLLAGEGGLPREVSSVGILDYELDPSVKDRYICDNFHHDMLVVATFLYAKKNPYLIGDAVRHLIQKGCSGLLIRNVFNLPIPETVLRYADSKDFPILLVNGSGIYFEDFVYEVTRRREQLASFDFYTDELNALLTSDTSEQEVIRHTKSIVPSLKPSYFLACAIPAEPLETDTYLALVRAYRQSRLFSISNKLVRHGNALIFIYSSDTLSQDYGKMLFEEIFQLFKSTCDGPLRMGVGAPHYYLREFRNALLESRYAASYLPAGTDGYMLYDHLGVYQLILPYCHSEEFRKFSEHILDPIRDYDTENGTALFETLLTYTEHDMNLKKTAGLLGQHENTIRYRLEKIHSLCSLNYRSSAVAEQLSLAVKVHIARQMISDIQ